MKILMHLYLAEQQVNQVFCIYKYITIELIKNFKVIKKI